MYQVYVIELRRKVYSENVKFREANPQFNGVLECLYVGMTSKTPRQRLEQHLTGAKSKKGGKLASFIVKKYGSYLRTSLASHLPQYTSLNEALLAEQALAAELRRQRYAVWVN